jgi:hypothetical protein
MRHLVLALALLTGLGAATANAQPPDAQKQIDNANKILNAGKTANPGEIVKDPTTSRTGQQTTPPPQSVTHGNGKNTANIGQ